MSGKRWFGNRARAGVVILAAGSTLCVIEHGGFSVLFAISGIFVQ